MKTTQTQTTTSALRRSINGGEVLLCYSATLRVQDKECTYGYAHAALCIDNSRVLESSKKKGVAVSSIDKLRDEYDHIAVLGSEDIWSSERLELLKKFSERVNGKGFKDIRGYHERKKSLQETSSQRLEDFFEGIISRTQGENEKYFCSELVVAAFIGVGIISNAASVLLTPEIFSPEGIGRDKLFGDFIGYLVPYTGYKLPENDMFDGELPQDT